MSAQNLHAAALRIPILHILRAAGFHSTKPSVLDTLVNITERYLLLLAGQTVSHALANHNSLAPELADVRMALVDGGILLPVHGSAEDEWAERLRSPAASYDTMAFGDLRRDKEMQRRLEEDNADVRAFTEWITGDRYKEIRRIAGLLPDGSGAAGPGRAAGADVGGTVAHDDFLTQLKKRNRVAVDEERWAGTILGTHQDDKEVAIQGGEVGSVDEWERLLRAKEVNTAEKAQAVPTDAMEVSPG